MARRGLLIGSETFGLAGCDADVALVRGLLEARGFEVEQRTGRDASRAGILAAFEQLVAATGADDAVVVFYSGHGGRLPHPDWQSRRDAGLPGHLQFLVPWDIEESTEDDFRGLLSEELTALQWRLTERTRNITTILDCCHSGYMARNAELIPKAVNRSFPVEGALARLDALAPAYGNGGTDTNPYAVRVVACQPDQSAYERASELDDGRHGVLTESLALVLGDLGDRRISWTTIGTLVRDRVVSVVPHQQPEVEGPSGRLPFSLEVPARPQAYPVTVAPGRASIEAAPLLGISEGDRFRIVPPDEDRTLATAEVARLEGEDAILELSREPGTADLPAGCEAVPVTVTLPRRAVRLAPNGVPHDELRAAISQSARLRLAEGDEPVLATIRSDGELVVEDSGGLPVRKGALAQDAQGKRQAVELVELLAAADRLRALASGTGDAALDASVDVELVRHVDGSRTRCDLKGERLFVGDKLSLTIRNRSQREIFVWVFDIGVSNRITLLTNDAPRGAKLEPAGTPGDTRTLGGESGRAIEWAADVPEDGARPEVFLVVLADRQQDLRGLQTPIGATAQARGVHSPLDAILEEVRSGTREFPAEVAEDGLRYRIERVEFFLEPRPRPRLGEPAFEIDDRPHPSMRILLPRAAAPPPAKVAVRLVEMAVRKNRALFKADVRVDALVVTRGPEGGQGVAFPTTFRFPRIGDATQLPLENVLLYHGDVRDFLELALWVNRDDKKGRELAELFSTEMNRPEIQAALTTLGGLALAAPQVTLAVGAVAAVATLVVVGARLVEVATGKDIGTYRTSKLAFERFGVGRTPPAGRRQSQDVEFAYEVIEIE